MKHHRIFLLLALAFLLLPGCGSTPQSEITLPSETAAVSEETPAETPAPDLVQEGAENFGEGMDED